MSSSWSVNRVVNLRGFSSDCLSMKSLTSWTYFLICDWDRPWRHVSLRDTLLDFNPCTFENSPHKFIRGRLHSSAKIRSSKFVSLIQDLESTFSSPIQFQESSTESTQSYHGHKFLTRPCNPKDRPNDLVLICVCTLQCPCPIPSESSLEMFPLRNS